MMGDVWDCETTYILNLFAIMTGCRRGEIIGLLNKYVHNEYVEIIHSWSRRSGLKATTTNESRVIPIHSGLSRWLNMIKGRILMVLYSLLMMVKNHTLITGYKRYFILLLKKLDK